MMSKRVTTKVSPSVLSNDHDAGRNYRITRLLGVFVVASYFAFYSFQLMTAHVPIWSLLPAFAGSTVGLFGFFVHTKWSHGMESALCAISYVLIAAILIGKNEMLSAGLHAPAAIAYGLRTVSELPVRFAVPNRMHAAIKIIAYALPAISEPPYVYATAVAFAEWARMRFFDF